MHPVIFKVGPWVARSYGVMLAVSFLAGLAVASRRAKRVGIEPQLVHRLAFFILIAAFVGARLGFVIVNYRAYAADPVAIFDFYEDGELRLDGLVMNGAVVLSVMVVVLFTHCHRLPIWRTMDVFAPCLALGIFLTRIGCFLNGCCFGKPTVLPWGVIFPPDCPAGVYQRAARAELPPLHPTQLYSSAYGLAILVVLFWLERKRRFDGCTTLVLFLLYAVARFAVEFFRVYSDQTGVYLGLTHNQHLSLVLVLASATGLRVLHHRTRRDGTLQSV